MGLDISFLLERREAGRWVSPPEFVNRSQRPPLRGVAELCWWSARDELTGLFFGDEALYPLRPGLPPDLSPEVRAWAAGNFYEGHPYAGWLPVADLHLERWESQTVLVGGLVPARYASLFSDGRSPPPVEALAAAGVEEPVLERVTDWGCARQSRPRDWSGARARELSRFPATEPVPVTWTEPLAKFAAGIWEGNDSERGLRALLERRGEGEDRIVTAGG